jgi:hypothetical protein
LKERTKGKIILIVGYYLAIVYPISSVSYEISRIEAFVPYGPLSSWIWWLLMYGILTLTLVIVGIYFIKVGNKVIKESKKDLA